MYILRKKEKKKGGGREIGSSKERKEIKNTYSKLHRGR